MFFWFVRRVCVQAPDHPASLAYTTGERTHWHWWKKNEKVEKQRLKTVKSVVATQSRLDPSHNTLRRIISANPKKEMDRKERFRAIERENHRLLARMSRIMLLGSGCVDSHYEAPLCPALDKARTRRREVKELTKANQKMLGRIITAKPYYCKEDWDADAERIGHLGEHMCKYPRVLPPLGPHRLAEWMEERAGTAEGEYDDYILNDDGGGAQAVAFARPTSRGGGRRSRNSADGGSDTESEEDSRRGRVDSPLAMTRAGEPLDVVSELPEEEYEEEFESEDGPVE